MKKTLRRAWGRLGTRRQAAASSPPGFDAGFYGSYHPDLKDLVGEAALAEHYLRYGRGEGRAANPEGLVADLEAALGRLPDDFLPFQYRAFNRDLAHIAKAWELEVHYLTFGRPERRSYRFDLSADERDLARLYAGEAAAAGPGLEEMLDAAGLLPGVWLERFVLFEFGLLNADWLPHPPVSRADGLRQFLRHGVERLAPISLRERFDPGFYRASGARPAGSTDADLYRDWLNHGIPLGHPANEGMALAALIGEDTFPDAFREDLYRATTSRDAAGPGPGRFAALEHFVATGFAALGGEVVEGPGAARLYEQVGDHHLQRGEAATAVKAFDRALAAGPDAGRIRHRRGDAWLALNRPGEAAEDFTAAADRPGASLWSHIHAAELVAARPGGIPDALDRLTRSAPACRHADAWRAAGHRIVGQAFDEASRRARELYAGGRRGEADACLTECLDRLAQVIRAIDPLPAPLPAAREGLVVILANRDLPQCDHYRVVQKREQLERAGWSVEIYAQHEGARARLALDRASAAIFYRVAAFPAVLHAILYARALGIPTVYEIDDLIFDPTHYPDPFESFEGQITAAEYAGLQYGVPLFRYAMRHCETGLASTPALAQAMRPIVRSGICHVLRNGLDARNAPFLARPWTPLSAGTLTIFYGSGTKAHNRDFNEIAAPALAGILGRHAHVRLVVAGYLQLDGRLAAFADRVVQLGFSPDVAAYWETLSGADISLAVLAPGRMADAKSEIKWLEAAMCGIPSVVSATRTYREVLVDGEDAFLADTPEDWSRALDALVGDGDLRRTMGRRARTKAVREYGPERAATILSGFLPPPPPAGRARGGAAGTMVKGRDPGETGAARMPAGGGVPERRARLLIVAVFFPPQTIGGATRVVRDNVDHVLDHAADAFEIAVATTDLDAEPAYRTRIDAYRGVPVYRIAAPKQARGDWRGFDPAMREPFEALLDRFEPDLVHVHCVQRLTATVVEAVAERGLPYVVTLHDAWWISDFQFLVDEDGRLRTPSPDPLRDGLSRSFDPVASVARRRRLGRLLDGAARLLAVSEAFADLYRAAGHPRTLAMPNGVSALPRAERRPSLDGRVRLGQIGGRTVHKGAVLIEAVLRANAFDRLAMTIVDHAHDGDYLREEVWGTTPVRIVGMTPQDRIGELYAGLDVLLAPSLWPESFGLVTREARAAGLWVVASDRGAIGEDVADGVDGFRIDVSGPDGLRRVLALIDADPRRFLASPPPAPAAPRSMADQGADLVALYADLSQTPGTGRTMAAS